MKKRGAIFLVLFGFAAVFTVTGKAGILPVPLKYQEQDQWCWAGSSQAILSYYGKSYTQTAIAQYGTHGYNTWNWLYGYDNESPYYRRGIDYILSYFGSISSTGRAYALSQGTVTSEIAAGRPFVIRWGWYPTPSTSGHFIVGRGIVGSTVYFMNPWPGEGYGAGTYSWVLDDGVHKWDYSLQLNTSPAPPTTTRAPLQLYAGDFSGNSRSDIAVFRSSNGLWSVRGVTRAYYGQAGDIPVPADFNGDGRSDIAVFRPSTGLWLVRGVTRFYFGQNGDVPIPASYHTGYCTAGIFRPSNGLWSWRGGGRSYFGQSGDIPVPGPYVSRSGKWGATYNTIFRPSSGLWSVKGVTRFYFGGSGDTPVPGAYTTSSTAPWTGAIFRPSTGLWSIRNGNRCYFGGSGDTPVPGDYDLSWGDEVAIFRPSTGLWSIRNFTRCYFGSSATTPATR